jgi:DNA-binding NarL/FixJ family response regulator
MSEIRIIIVDDHPLFRQGLRDVLETDAHLHVVAEAADGEVAIQKAYQFEPDIILMDINLPTANGLQVTSKIVSALPSTRVITITGYDDAQQIFHAFRSGAHAYCPKDIMPEKLIGIIRSVNDGFYVVGENRLTYKELVSWFEDKIGIPGSMTDSSSDSFVPLSAREMEILELVTNGMSNKEIAFQLGISHQTVKNHMTAILRKLRVDDRTQAAVYALSNGWVRLPTIRT